MLSRFLSPKVRIWFGWVLVIGTTIGTPFAFWLSPDEPPIVLGLSLLAIWIEGYNALQIACEAE